MLLKSTIDTIFQETGKQRGDNISYHCPSCNHRKQKLVYNIKLDIFHCWVCSFRGKGLFKVFKLLGTTRETQQLYYQHVKYVKNPSVPLESLRVTLYNKLFGD